MLLGGVTGTLGCGGVDDGVLALSLPPPHEVTHTAKKAARADDRRRSMAVCLRDRAWADSNFSR